MTCAGAPPAQVRVAEKSQREEQRNALWIKPVRSETKAFYDLSRSLFSVYVFLALVLAPETNIAFPYPSCGRGTSSLAFLCVLCCERTGFLLSSDFLLAKTIRRCYNQRRQYWTKGKWRNGRRAGFRSQCPEGCGGSNPPFPTIKLNPAH